MERRAHYAGKEVRTDHAYRAGKSRTDDNGELYASLKNAALFLPFVRKTYIFGMGKPPEWLSEFGDKVEYVRQTDVMPAEINPCFNSSVIESYIHLIPGLSEHYIYSNDDCFFARVHSECDFFDEDGRAIIGLSPWILGLSPTPTYRAIEANTVRAMRRHITLPPYVRTYRSRSFGLDPKVRFKLALRGLKMLNRTAHVSQPYIKSFWDEFHRLFADEMRQLRGLRFRSGAGMNTNMMYAYLARARGKAVMRAAPDHLYVGRDTAPGQLQIFADEILSDDHLITRFCLNDCPVEGEDEWPAYVRSLTDALLRKHGAEPVAREPGTT